MSFNDPAERRAAFHALVAAGRGVRDAQGRVSLAVASRLFACPACPGRVQLALDAEGHAAALHTFPTCGHYVENETVESVLGPANFALLGEGWWD